MTNQHGLADEPAITWFDIAQDRSIWPRDVAITKDITVPLIANGKQLGTAKLLAGTLVKLVHVHGETINIQYAETTYTVSSQDTDIVLRATAIRQAQDEARHLAAERAMATAKARQQAQEAVREAERREAENRARLDQEAAKLAIDLPALTKRTRPAVMHVTTTNANGGSLGTGFMVSADGWMVTNHHVINDAQSVTATDHEGRTYQATGWLAIDVANDLAIVQLERAKLATLKLGPSDRMEAGMRIAVIGSPLGLEGTLTEGIISARRKMTGRDSATLIEVLQISAAISPGSSGSPVLNAGGEVIGVAVAKSRDGEALNFAVPSNAVLALLKSIGPSATVHRFDPIPTRPVADAGNAPVQPPRQVPNAKPDNRVVQLGFNQAFNINPLGNGMYSANLYRKSTDSVLYVEFSQEGLGFVRSAVNVKEPEPSNYVDPVTGVWHWRVGGRSKTYFKVYANPFITTVTNPFGVVTQVEGYRLIGTTSTTRMGKGTTYHW